MAWPPNWYITAAFETWVDNTRHCVYNTDVPVHQYMIVSPVKRFPRTRWVWFRGISQQHGVSWHFVPEYTIEQQELGDTLIHTFDIPGWAYCNILYWYMIADKDGFRTPSVSPIFEAHYTGGTPPPLPVPLPIPVSWAVADPRIRCGNRYTFWARDKWYIFVPTSTVLTMWTYDAGVITRQDQAHEPLAVGGAWVDADARLDAIRQDLHVGAFLLRPSGTLNAIDYVIFDTRLNAWGALNLIATPARTAGCYTSISLTIDASADPTFWYTNSPTVFSTINAIIYNGGFPDPPVVVLTAAYNMFWYTTAYHDLISGDRAVAAVTNTYWLHTRRRSNFGVWSPQVTFTDRSLNLSHHSLSANDGHFDLANIARYFALDYHRDVPPWDNFPGMVPATNQYANSLTNVGAPNQLLIVYKGNDNQLWSLYRSPDLAWHPPDHYPFPVGSTLAATHAEPDVASCIWQSAPPNNITFFAFYEPWAT